MMRAKCKDCGREATRLCFVEGSVTCHNCIDEHHFAHRGVQLDNLPQSIDKIRTWQSGHSSERNNAEIETLASPLTANVRKLCERLTEFAVRAESGVLAEYGALTAPLPKIGEANTHAFIHELQQNGSLRKFAWQTRQQLKFAEKNATSNFSDVADVVTRAVGALMRVVEPCVKQIASGLETLESAFAEQSLAERDWQLRLREARAEKGASPLRTAEEEAEIAAWAQDWEKAMDSLIGSFKSGETVKIRKCALFRLQRIDRSARLPRGEQSQIRES